MESKIWHKWTYLLNRNRFKRLFDSHQHIFIEVKLTDNIVLISTVEWLSYTFCCCCCCLVAQSCPILCNPTDCSPPGSSVHGILQARILEWVTIPFSRGSSRPRDQTWVSCITGRCFTVWATRETYVHSLFIGFSMIVYHRISNIVPPAIQ